MEFSFRTLMIIVIAMIAAVILIGMMSSWGTGSQDIFNNTVTWIRGMMGSR